MDQIGAGYFGSPRYFGKVVMAREVNAPLRPKRLPGVIPGRQAGGL